MLNSAEICDACSTINAGSARLCKCCSHKLPAYYAGTDQDALALPQRPTPVSTSRAARLDFAAFCLVINGLVIITNHIPFP